MHVIASPEISDAAALVIRRGEPVLVLRDGLLSPPDLDLVGNVLAAVSVIAAVGAHVPGLT